LNFFNDDEVCFLFPTVAGFILWYAVLRDGYEIFRDSTALTYNDNNAILPYHTYSYRIQACNSAGCTESPEVRNTVVFIEAKSSSYSIEILNIKVSRIMNKV
jgi:hypothetical protein